MLKNMWAVDSWQAITNKVSNVHEHVYELSHTGPRQAQVPQVCPETDMNRN